ncbi:hypothetical protein ID866_8853 [Astraeus odoratus]|nr:hypothetical protein ID866_8853 [Astraeus odoratus]
MDPRVTLEEIARRASRYGVKVHNIVDVDQSRIPIFTLKTAVCQGILRPCGTKVALKTLRFPRFGDDLAIKRVLHEIHVWSKLRHDNILPLIGITTQVNHTVSALCEWQDRGNAYDYVKDCEVDPRPLILGIARGLLYLHDHRPGAIFHGDLKGQNVLISNDGHPLLTDFGFSYLEDSSFSLTVSVPSGGTIPWTAPELLDGGKISAQGDVWAFGMTTLELLTRQRPFHNFHTASSVVSQIVQGRLPCRPTDESTCFRMTDEWWEMCTSCWSMDPSRRPHMSSIILGLERIMV